MTPIWPTQKTNIHRTKSAFTSANRRSNLSSTKPMMSSRWPFAASLMTAISGSSLFREELADIFSQSFNRRRDGGESLIQLCRQLLAKVR